MSVRSIGPAAIKSVLQKIKDGQYYDGSQMGITLINRCVSRGLDSEAVRLCFLFGMEMVKANQFDLSSSLGILMIKIFTEFELEVTDERIQMILDLFTPTPPNPSEERSRFIERAIKWASMDSGAESHLRTLHAAAGKAYQESGQFGQAQGHLVYCGDADALALLLKEWRQKGYPSEQELFVLRLILILLAKGDVSVAKSVLESNEFAFNFDSPSLPPALQFAYLLIQASQSNNADFFDTLQTKYLLVIRRDPTFKRLLQCIDQQIFHRNPQGSGSILSALSNLMDPSK